MDFSGSGEDEGGLLLQEMGVKDGAAPDEEKEDISCLSRMFRWKWMEGAVLVCQLVAYIACNMGYSLIGPFFPGEAEDKGVSSAAIGLIIACTPLTVVVLSPVVGYILPRVGVLLPVIVGLLLVGFSYISLAFVILIPQAWGFILVSILLRVTEGVGTAMYVTAVLMTAPTLFPGQVTVFMGVIQISAGVGYGIGYVLGGLLYAVGGFKLPFLSVGGFILAMVLPCALLVRNIKIEESEKESLPFMAILNLSTDLVFIALALAIVYAAASFTFYIPKLQPYLEEEFHLNSVQVALVLLLMTAVFSVASIFFAPVVQKLDNSRFSSVGGLTLCALGYATVSLQSFINVSSLWFVICGLSLVGLGAAFGILPIYANMLQVARMAHSVTLSLVPQILFQMSGNYMKEKYSKIALVSFIAGVVSSSILSGEFLGNIVGGVLNTFLSFPESCLVCAEFILTEVLLLAGITIIERTFDRHFKRHS